MVFMFCLAKAVLPTTVYYNFFLALFCLKNTQQIQGYYTEERRVRGFFFSLYFSLVGTTRSRDNVCYS